MDRRNAQLRAKVPDHVLTPIECDDDPTRRSRPQQCGSGSWIRTPVVAWQARRLRPGVDRCRGDDDREDGGIDDRIPVGSRLFSAASRG